MTEQLDAVLDTTARLQQIRARIAEIDREQAALQEEAAQLLQQLAHTATAERAAAKGTEWKDSRLPLPRRIIGFLAAYPAEQFRVTAIAAALGFTRTREVNLVRGTLGRLERERRVVRIAWGCYAHQPGAV